jgi:hypothetical protein
MRIDNIASQGMRGCTSAPATLSIQRAISVQNRCFPRTHRHRNGSSRYICNSYGRDQRTSTIDFTCARFWMSKKLAMISRLPPKGATERPWMPFTSEVRRSARALATVSRLSG